MAFGIPFAFVIDSLFNEADVSVPHGCRPTATSGSKPRSHSVVRKPRGNCGPSRQHPYWTPHARCSPARADTRRDELRALDDSYVLFVDLPGFSKEQVKVKVDDGFLVVSTADQSPAQEAGPVKAVLMERRRGGLHQRWKLPDDALLDGIHAKLQNGELVVVIPKRTEKVPKHFVIPVLGADEPASAPQLEASAPAQAPEAPAAQHPMTAKPELAAQAEPVADAPMAAEAAHSAHAENASDAPASTNAAAAPTDAEAPAAPALADAPAVPAPADASAPLAAAVAAADAAMPDAKEDDGSWTDVSDEEREAMQAVVRAKGKAPMEGPVLEEIERQEAQRIAQMQHDSDAE